MKNSESMGKENLQNKIFGNSILVISANQVMVSVLGILVTS